MRKKRIVSAPARVLAQRWRWPRKASMRVGVDCRSAPRDSNGEEVRFEGGGGAAAAEDVSMGLPEGSDDTVPVGSARAAGCFSSVIAASAGGDIVGG